MLHAYKSTFEASPEWSDSSCREWDPKILTIVSSIGATMAMSQDWYREGQHLGDEVADVAGAIENLKSLFSSWVPADLYAQTLTWMAADVSNNTTFNGDLAAALASIKIPFLSDIPIIGPTLFQQNFFVYGAIILVIATTYYIFKTSIGLRLRAVGEHPKAADTLGVNVLRIRYLNVTLAGMVAGFGGAWFTLGSVGRFDEAMTGGRGFIGLAAMIFGRWHPVGALMAALVFGFADSLQQKLAILRTPIPSEFLAMAPYVATIVLVAGLIGRARAPKAIGKPYVKE